MLYALIQFMTVSVQHGFINLVTVLFEVVKPLKIVITMLTLATLV